MDFFKLENVLKKNVGFDCLKEIKRIFNDELIEMTELPKYLDTNGMSIYKYASITSIDVKRKF